MLWVNRDSYQFLTLISQDAAIQKSRDLIEDYDTCECVKALTSEGRWLCVNSFLCPLASMVENRHVVSYSTDNSQAETFHEMVEQIYPSERSRDYIKDACIVTPSQIQ